MSRQRICTADSSSSQEWSQKEPMQTRNVFTNMRRHVILEPGCHKTRMEQKMSVTSHNVLRTGKRLNTAFSRSPSTVFLFAPHQCPFWCKVFEMDNKTYMQTKSKHAINNHRWGLEMNIITNHQITQKKLCSAFCSEWSQLITRKTLHKSDFLGSCYQRGVCQI